MRNKTIKSVFKTSSPNYFIQVFLIDIHLLYNNWKEQAFNLGIL